MRKHTKSTIVASLAAAAALAGSAVESQAQDFPTKPITVIVGVSAGSAPDVNARLISAQLEKQLGEPVVVENRGGSNGIIALQALKQSEPDGYTLAYMSTPYSLNPSVYKELPFNTREDFVAVALTGTSDGYLLLANPDLPADNVEELTEYAKDNRVLFGSPGVGSHLHLGGELLKLAIGGQLEHVPYKGVGEAIPALISGDIQLLFASPTSTLEYVKSNDLKVLAVAGAERLEALPDVPLITDTVPDFSLDGWHGWLAPAGTPQDVVDKLNAEIRKALKEPEVEKAIMAGSYRPADLSPDEVQAFLNRQEDQWAKAVEASGMERQ